MNALFSSRAGISIFGGGVSCKATWPLGKVILNQEALIIDALFASYRLRHADIDGVRSRFFSVEIRHHAADVPEMVQVWGFRLFS